MQVGTPQDIYHRPGSTFVADFVGSSNVLPATFVERFTGRARPASLRPEALRLVADGGHEATVVHASFLGAMTRIAVRLDGVELTALTALTGNAVRLPEPGTVVRIDWDADHMHLMDETDG